MNQNVVPPQDQLAEESVLGAMLLAPAAIDKAREILDAADFYRESHAIIYRAALDLYDSGSPVDAVTLVDHLDKRSELDRVGGRTRVHEIANLVPASSNVGHYASIVRDLSTRRGLIVAGGEVAQLGWDGDGEALDLVSRADEIMADVRARRDVETDEMFSLYDAATYLDEKFRNPPDESTWLPGPWQFIPRMGPGRLYVLSGYAKDGKTSGGLQMFDAVCKAERKATFLSLEMSKEDVAERYAGILGLPAKNVQSGRMTDALANVRKHVLDTMVQRSAYGTIWDAPSVDVPTIRAHVKKHRPDLLVVDHLHQFHLRAELERQDLEGIVRGLWRLAREFQIVVLLLAQLSRSGDKRHPFPMPTMTALKGSGAIEQLAWAVWFLYRQRDDNNLPMDDTLFVVAANRSGATGTRRLMFHPRTVHFTEIAYAA